MPKGGEEVGNLAAPDLALLINAGVYEYGSWFPSLAALAAHGFPATITTLSHLDHACSRSFLAALTRGEATLLPGAIDEKTTTEAERLEWSKKGNGSMWPRVSAQGRNPFGALLYINEDSSIENEEFPLINDDFGATRRHARQPARSGERLPLLHFKIAFCSTFTLFLLYICSTFTHFIFHLSGGGVRRSQPRLHSPGTAEVIKEMWARERSRERSREGEIYGG